RGTIKVIGGGTSWPYSITGLADGFTVTFAIGDTRWCSDFRTPLAKSTSRRVLAKSAGSFSSTFEALQDVIFTKHGCTQAACHGTAAQGGLDLQPDVAYQNLVDVFSPAGQMKRVAPGDEQQSFLWRKLAKATLGLTGVPGAAMPNGLPAVPAEQLEALKIWIRAGAPATGAAPPGAPRETAGGVEVWAPRGPPRHGRRRRDRRPPLVVLPGRRPDPHPSTRSARTAGRCPAACPRLADRSAGRGRGLLR